MRRMPAESFTGDFESERARIRVVSGFRTRKIWHLIEQPFLYGTRTRGDSRGYTARSDDLEAGVGVALFVGSTEASDGRLARAGQIGRSRQGAASPLGVSLYICHSRPMNGSRNHDAPRVGIRRHIVASGPRQTVPIAGPAPSVPPTGFAAGPSSLAATLEWFRSALTA
jgi:hypothetical protein